MADSPAPSSAFDIPSRRSTSSPSTAHRSSFAENLRNSPRSQRHPSLTQASIQDLLNHPPAGKSIDPRFSGRDWRHICVRELVQAADIKWAELNTDFENATKTLMGSGSPEVILIRESSTDTTAIDTFDYSDLTAFLLVILGLAKPGGHQIELYSDLAKKSQDRVPIPLGDIRTLAKKAPLVTLSESDDLSKAIEQFGSGVHRILVCKDGTTEVVGVLSQLKLVQFLWENGVHFQSISQLYPIQLRELDIGTHATISINGDHALQDALQLMNEEGLTSLPVVDNALNVVGNISNTDSRLLTRASSLPLLKNTCIHFISVILSERGIQDGKDSFPVFHVNPYSTLAQTVQKLVATSSHRVWVVEPASPSPSTPATPSSSHAGHHQAGSTPVSPNFPSVPAASLPGASISGRLTGVISLTDVLNLFARQSGLHPLSTNDQRDRRRGSSSSSKRPSIDSAR